MSEEITKLETELGRLVFEVQLLEEKRVAIVQQQNPLRQKANAIATQLKIMKKIPDSATGDDK